MHNLTCSGLPLTPLPVPGVIPNLVARKILSLFPVRFSLKMLFSSSTDSFQQLAIFRSTPRYRHICLQYPRNDSPHRMRRPGPKKLQHVEM